MPRPVPQPLPVSPEAAVAGPVPVPQLGAEEADALRTVDRARIALRCAETVAIAGDREVLLALAVETLTTEGLARLRRLAGSALTLAMSRRRVAALGLCADGPGVMTLIPATELSAAGAQGLLEPLRRAAPLTIELRDAAEAGAESTATAAVRLAKIANLLPAAVVATVAGDRSAGPAWAARHDLRFVTPCCIDGYQRAAARALRRVAEARVPLADCQDTRIIAFRPANGGHEHLAIIVGTPAVSEPVLVRLHSECFTGDILGSLRCDCGEQLRRAIVEIAARGSGMVLYLAQEGRGIGLVNKLRAYQLQDQGYDTLDANEMLGFEADERLYLPAAEMLHQLGFDRVRLMTNNPDKLTQLERCGIAVVERVPHVIPGNRHNEAYLRAKAERGGHLF
ncbi:GTP cyclohydrolase-2 [Azospirillaceae bacterium]